MTHSDTHAVIESCEGLPIAHLGAALKSTYVEVLTANADIGDRFASLLMPAVEQVSRESAEALDAAYRSGSPPMHDDADSDAFHRAVRAALSPCIMSGVLARE
jgi:hypothetical protein